jgi:hypothetical protein
MPAKKAISTQQTPANIAAVMALLTDAPAQLARLSASLPEARLRQPLGPGQRSFAEVLAHLLYCEALTADAIYQALLLDEPLIADIHAERQLGKLLRFDLLPFRDLLAYFNLRRAVLLRVLTGLDDKGWSRAIREAGKQRKESVYWRARGQALHEVEHVTEIESGLKRLR